MSSCTCHADLKEIVHSGPSIGDDWSFSVTIDGKTRSFDANGLGASRDRIVFDEPLRWTTNGGGCGEVVALDIHVEATEHDVFFDDQGAERRTLTVRCPEDGEQVRRLEDQQIAARVTERPFKAARVHFVTFVFDFETVCS